MELGKKIESLRKAKNWSQSDLAAAMEESRQSISQWEAGTRLPELDRLIHLSMLFEVPLLELLGEQRNAYDLGDHLDPQKEAEKRKKDRLLHLIKILCAGIVIVIAIIVNLLWFRFLLRLFLIIQ